MGNISKTKAVNRFFPVYIVSYIGLTFIFVLILSLFRVELPLWAQYVVSQFFVLVPAVFYVVLFKKYAPSGILYKPLKPLDALLSLLTGYALIPLVLFIGNISMFFVDNHMEESLIGLTKYPMFVQLIIVAVIPPVVEEFVFRGLFFQTYRENRTFSAAVVSAVLFGLFHLNINQLCYAFVAGFIFAYMVEATGSIWSSVIAHFAINSFSIFTLELQKRLLKSAEISITNDDSQVISDLTTKGMLTQLFILFFIAVIFTELAVRMIRKMAYRNGRKQNMRIFGVGEYRRGFKEIITLPLIITSVFCIIYMIMIEL